MPPGCISPDLTTEPASLIPFSTASSSPVHLTSELSMVATATTMFQGVSTEEPLTYRPPAVLMSTFSSLLPPVTLMSVPLVNRLYALSESVVIVEPPSTVMPPSAATYSSQPSSPRRSSPT